MTQGSSDVPRWHYRRSLASRVILLTTIAVGLSVTLVSLGAFITVRMQLKHSVDNSLISHAYRAASVVDQLVQSGSTKLPVSDVQLAATDTELGLVNSNGTVLLRQPEVSITHTEVAVAAGEQPESLRTVRIGATDYRVVAVPVGRTGLALVLAQSLDPEDDLLAKLSLVSLLFGVAGIIAAGVAGWAVARNGLRPVRELTSSVEEIARTEDLTPLPVEGGDEVARLATAFNLVLTSLAASRDRQRRLVADAGHELRTPLTSLRTNIELLTQASAAGLQLSEESRAELMADVRAQIEELSTLVGDLVELARDDPAGSVVATVDLADIVDMAVTRVRRRAVGLTLSVHSQPWYLEGETPALERAITNLLDNAAKWSPPGGTVTVTLADGALTVDDEGPGIAEADRPHVFERFYRSSESRAMPGSGLGLSIVARVAERHSGTVAADRSPAGGARLVLRIPGSPHPKPDGPPDLVTAYVGPDALTR